jgi:hypothetical protein
MGRHKETYTAKWNAQRRPTIDGQGKVRIPLEIQHGDAGRRVDLSLTDEELDSVTKAVREARLLHAIEHERAQQRERALKLQLHVWDLERQKKELEREKEELKGMIERVHDVVHPDRSPVVDFPERPVVVAPSSNVAH